MVRRRELWNSNTDARLERLFHHLRRPLGLAGPVGGDTNTTRSNKTASILTERRKQIWRKSVRKREEMKEKSSSFSLHSAPLWLATDRLTDGEQQRDEVASLKPSE